MKNDVQTIKKNFLTEKVIICVQITMSGKSKLYMCAKDFYLCVKAIFPIIFLLPPQIFLKNAWGKPHIRIMFHRLTN